jgi:hypothetical protein
MMFPLWCPLLCKPCPWCIHVSRSWPGGTMSRSEGRVVVFVRHRHLSHTAVVVPCLWLCINKIRSPDRPARSQSLYRLSYRAHIWNKSTNRIAVKHNCLLTLLLMSYIYGALCKARNFNVVYIWTYVWQRWKPSLSICWTLFQHWINAESYPVSQLCVNTSPATKITLIADGT